MDKKYAIGNFICELRQQKGWTQKELGELLGVTNKAVSKWETGAALPRVEYLQQLAVVLGCKQEELFLGRRIAEGEGREPVDTRALEESYLSVVQRCDCCKHESKTIFGETLDENRNSVETCKKCGATIRKRSASIALQYLSALIIATVFESIAIEWAERITRGMFAEYFASHAEAQAHSIMLEYFPNAVTCARYARVLILITALAAAGIVFYLFNRFILKKIFKYKVVRYPHAEDGKIVF